MISFIMGAQRSGTTLLGMILSANQKIQVVDEDNLAYHYQGGETLLLDLDAAANLCRTSRDSVCFKVPRDTHRIDEILTVFPEAKILWVTRSLFPTVASMSSLKILGQKSWALTHAPREIIKYLERFSEDHKVHEAFQQASELGDSRLKELTLATLCWEAKVRTMHWADKKYGGFLIEVSYEALIAETRSVTNEVCEFLGLGWSDRMLRHHKYTHGKRPGGSVTNRPVDKANNVKWKNILSRQDRAEIERIQQSFRLKGAY